MQRTLRSLIIAIITLAVIVLSSCSSASAPSSADHLLGIPYFSVPAGFYSDDFELEIIGSDNMTIRYTLDGTEPTANSAVYDGPIQITNRTMAPNDLSAVTGLCPDGDYIPSSPVSKGTVVRAAIFSDNGARGEIATATYFVGLDYGDAMVVSIVTDIDGLFDYEKGIFMLGKHFDEWKNEVGASIGNYGTWEYKGNYSMKGDEWEREINIEFFESGELSLSQIAGMRVAGAATRTYRQKSLRITARSQYGEKRFNAPLIPNNSKDGFPDDTVSEYRSFVLRNGGNDSDFGRIRDPFIQNSVSDCSFSTQQTRPAIAFINGEYWGVYTLTEDYNERYIEENYGVDKGNVAIIKNHELEEGNEEDISLFNDVQNYILSNDMSIAENYSRACEMIDMTGFAQYCALHLYIGSEDGPFQYNNWRAWRAVETSDAPFHDGKIRFMLYDTEYALGIYSDGGNYDLDTFSALQDNHSYCGSIFNALMENSTFCDLFVYEFLEMRNRRFAPDTSKEIIRTLHLEYDSIMPEHYMRFGPSWISGYTVHFRNNINNIKKYIRGRYNTAPQLLCNYLGIDPDSSIVTADDGSISIIY